MEEWAFVVTLVVVVATFLFFGGFASAAGSAGVIFGIMLASAAYLGVYYLRNGKLI
jgi:uncharacterized membrane protein YtjA (UPF0391 family)